MLFEEERKVSPFVLYLFFFYFPFFEQTKRRRNPIWRKLTTLKRGKGIYDFPPFPATQAVGKIEGNQLRRRGGGGGGGRGPVIWLPHLFSSFPTSPPSLPFFRHNNTKPQ